MTPRVPSRLIPPISIVSVAIVVALISFLSAISNPRPVVREIGLGKDQTQTIVFSPAFSGPYLLGIEMDHAAALKQFPCVVDSRLWGNQAPCRNDNPAMDLPVELAFLLEGGGGAPLRTTYSAEGARGGRYGGDAFTLDVGRVSLSGRRRYKLTVTSLRDATTLNATGPRFIVEADPVEDTVRGVLWLGGFVLSGLLAVVATVWLAGMYFARQRSL
jgi:hypothetical protein